jgi:hypothetical protein
MGGLQRKVVGARVDRLDYRNIAQGESGFTVTQVVMPLADEVVIETEGAHLVEFGVKRLPPI